MANRVESGALLNGGSFVVTNIEGHTVISNIGARYRLPREVVPPPHHGAGHEWPKIGDTIVALFDLPPLPGARARARIEHGCGCDLVIEYVAPPKR